MITTQWCQTKGAKLDAHTFAIGDIHGQAGALSEMLDHLANLERPTECIAAGRELIFLGDIIDRGPENFAAVNLAFEAHKRFEKVFLLPGNHELMLLSAMKGNEKAKRLWAANGGMAMVDEVCPDGSLPLNTAILAIAQALPSSWAATYEYGPTHLRRGALGDVLFVHAGIHPHRHLDDFLDEPRFAIHDDHWAWMRQPFLNWHGGWGHMGLSLVVHGHSPATIAPITTAEKVSRLLDVTAEHDCICLDAGSLRLPQVAAVEFAANRYRLHLVEA